MIIGIVTETYWPDINGVAMTLNRLASGLLQKGHRLQLICPRHVDRDISKMPVNLNYQPVKGFPIPGYKDANFGLPSQELIERLWVTNKPDIVYVATEGPLGWSAVKLANQYGIPVVSGFHTNFHSYSKHYKIGFLEKIIKNYLISLHLKTLATVVPTDSQRDLVNDMGIDNVTVIGRGVDCDLYTPDKRNDALRKSWGAEEGDPVLLYVGRLAAEKNLDLAIETYRSMYKINPRIKFVLVGSGPLAKILHKENPELIFTGNKTGDELGIYYASSDIFIFPSLTETFGNVVLEAMASGLGVVAYNYAAAALHIKNRQNGMLACSDQSDEFIDVANLYLEDKQLLSKIKNSARNYATTQSWSHIVDQFENLLKKYGGTHSGTAVEGIGFGDISEVEYES